MRQKLKEEFRNRFSVVNFEESTIKKNLLKNGIPAFNLDYREAVNIFFKLHTEMSDEDIRLLNDILGLKYKEASLKDHKSFLNSCEENLLKTLIRLCDYSKDINSTVFKKKISYHSDSELLLDVFPKFNAFGQMKYSNFQRGSKYAMIDCKIHAERIAVLNEDSDLCVLRGLDYKLAWSLRNIKTISISNITIEQLRKVLRNINK
jgi:hypothetical protein